MARAINVASSTSPSQCLSTSRAPSLLFLTSSTVACTGRHGAYHSRAATAARRLPVDRARACQCPSSTSSSELSFKRHLMPVVARHAKDADVCPALGNVDTDGDAALPLLLLRDLLLLDLLLLLRNLPLCDLLSLLLLREECLRCFLCECERKRFVRLRPRELRLELSLEPLPDRDERDRCETRSSLTSCCLSGCAGDGGCAMRQSCLSFRQSCSTRSRCSSARRAAAASSSRRRAAQQLLRPL